MKRPTSREVRPSAKDCICDWPEGCGGTGYLHCDGCGGDICVCRCGGEMACHGCEECEGLEQPT